MASLWELPCHGSEICEMGKISYSFLPGQHDEITPNSCPCILIIKKRAVLELVFLPALPLLVHSVTHLANVY